MVASATVAQNIVYLKVAREIAAQFCARSCPVVFLKGISLLETAYPDLSKRFMADIDILVPKKYLQEGCQLLLEMGYESPRRTLEFRKLNPGGIPVWIDLHAGLWYFNEKKLWSRIKPKEKPVIARRPKGAEAIPMMTLSPEDNLLHIALHSILQDGAISETSLRDAAALLQHEGKNWSWENFWRRAREEGWARAAAIFVQDVILSEAKDLPIEDPSGFALRMTLFNPKISSYWRMWVAQERWGKKIKILWQVLFPPLGFLKLRYPHSPSWALPFVRIVDLLWKAVSQRIWYIKIRGKYAEQAE